MPVRSSHGRPRPMTSERDELPAGVHAPASPAATRDESGRLLPGPGTRELARKAAQARHEAAQIARLSGLWDAPEDHPFQPYQRLAREWRDAHMAELAASVGGGHVGPAPASVVASASLQLAASRYLHDLGAQTGDPKMLLDASKLADASRQSLLVAHELAAKEARARPRKAPDFSFLSEPSTD